MGLRNRSLMSSERSGESQNLSADTNSVPSASTEARSRTAVSAEESLVMSLPVMKKPS